MPGSVTRSGRPGAIPELRNNARRTALSVRLASAMELWFAKIAIGIQIKELADPPDFVCERMILTSFCACCQGWVVCIIAIIVLLELLVPTSLVKTGR